MDLAPRYQIDAVVDCVKVVLLRLDNLISTKENRDYCLAKLESLKEDMNTFPWEKKYIKQTQKMVDDIFSSWEKKYEDR